MWVGCTVTYGTSSQYSCQFSHIRMVLSVCIFFILVSCVVSFVQRSFVCRARQRTNKTDFLENWKKNNGYITQYIFSYCKMYYFKMKFKSLYHKERKPFLRERDSLRCWQQKGSKLSESKSVAPFAWPYRTPEGLLSLSGTISTSISLDFL